MTEFSPIALTFVLLLLVGQASGRSARFPSTIDPQTRWRRSALYWACWSLLPAGAGIADVISQVAFRRRIWDRGRPHWRLATRLYRRRTLRHGVEEPRPSGVFPDHLDHDRSGSVESKTNGAMLLQADRMISALTPEKAIQRQLVPVMAERMQRTLPYRWVLVGSAQATLSWPFMSVLIGWLVLFSRYSASERIRQRRRLRRDRGRKRSLSLALWLIVDFDGVLKAFRAPMREALMHLDLPAW